MKKPGFSPAASLDVFKAEGAFELVRATDHKVVGAWALECAERVMPYFEEQYPDDPRPRNALKALQTWIDTGAFRMGAIRKASLDSHAAAKEVGKDSPAASAAHAAGQAVATAHVPMHCLGAANYALRAISRATPNPAEAEAAVSDEREWQLCRLQTLSASGGNTHPSSGSLWRG